MPIKEKYIYQEGRDRKTEGRKIAMSYMTHEIAEKALELKKLFTWKEVREQLDVPLAVGSMRAYCQRYKQSLVDKPEEEKAKDWSLLVRRWY